jgi:hypothetical protein
MTTLQFKQISHRSENLLSQVLTWMDKGQQFSECIVFAFEFLFKGPTKRLSENKIYLQKGTKM